MRWEVSSNGEQLKGAYIGEGKDGLVTGVVAHPGKALKWWKPEFPRHMRQIEVSLHERVADALPDKVPALYEGLEEGGTVRGFVMDRIDAEPLGDVLKKHRAVPDEGLVQQVQADLLTIWRQCGVAHGDPHPWNILIADPVIELDDQTGANVLYDGRVWVIDFSRASTDPGQHARDLTHLISELGKFRRVVRR